MFTGFMESPQALSAQSGVHFLVLKGLTTGDAEQCFSQRGLLFSAQVGDTKTNARDLLMPCVDEDGEITRIVQGHVLLMSTFRKDTPGTIWTLVGASPVPWTAAQAKLMLDDILGERDLFWDALCLFCHATITRFGPQENVVPMLRMTSSVRTTIAVLGHAPDVATRQQHHRSLSNGQELYRGILDFGILDDPHGKHRLHYTVKNAMSVSNGLLAPVAEPPFAGMVAVLPDGFPASYLPDDLPRTLTRQQAADPEHVAAWLSRYAEFSVREGWRNQGFVKELFGVYDQMGALIDTRTDVALYLTLEKAQRCVTDYKNRLATCEREGKLLGEFAEKLGALEAQAQLDLGAAKAQIRHLTQVNRDQGRELEALRAVNVDSLTQRLAEARAEATEYRKLLELADQELRRADGQGTAAVPQAVKSAVELAAPTTWQELAAARSAFPHVAVPDTALAPAFKHLAHGRECSRWVARVWQALWALEAYAALRANGSSDSFYSYIKRHPVQGLTAQHVHQESETVRTSVRHREQRIFPSALGRVFFESNIGIDTGRNPAPRLYFLDDTGGDSGMVHVGYIGPRLSNTMTN